MKFEKKIYGDPLVNAIIAKAEGQKTHSRPYVWVSGDKEYSHITGGVILPKIDVPGFLLTIAVRSESNIIECLDEYESMDAYELIKKAQGIQTEYGVGVIQNWWGNPEELMSLVNEKNIEGNPVYISAPIDSNQKDAFQIYIARLVVGLSETYQTFFINNCQRLRNHISSFVPDGSERADKNPAIYLAGSIIHTLLLARPWEQAVETIQLIPTEFDEFQLYEQEQRKINLYHQLYGMTV